MKMRKLMRSVAKGTMKRLGYAKINRSMDSGRWRGVLGKWAYPRFIGEKRQHKGSKQPILKY